MSLLTSYTSKNFVLVDDYNYRCNQIECGKPEVAVELSNDQLVTTVDQWWRAIIEEKASFKYIGMNYSTAQSCAASMRSRFTFTQYQWLYGNYVVSNDIFLYGWHKGVGTPTLESEVSLQKHGNGCMYDVVVNAKCTTINYDKGARALDLNVRPLSNAVSQLPGWNTTVPLDGKHFNTAGLSNIALIVAPTYTTNFELVGEKVITTPSAFAELSGFNIDDWYRATVDYNAQLKYEGMTKTACRNLYNSLNNVNGWYLQTHPWVLSAYIDGEDKLNINWEHDTSITSWQCLNDFKATEDDSGMFTAELTLHAQKDYMTNTPSAFVPEGWPTLWSTKIPGFSRYL